MSFSGLSSLPQLPSLTDIGKAVGVSPGPLLTGQTTPAPTGSTGSSLGSKLLFGGLSLSQIVIILLGLLLIAAGIFSFDKTRELVVSGVKTGAKAVAA